MARKGENIRKRKDGRWEGRYHVIEDGIVKQKSVYAHSYREVKNKKLEKQRSQESQKTQMLTSKQVIQLVTVNQVAEKWLGDFQQHYKKSTYVKYKNIYEKQLKPIMGEESIVRLTSDFVKSKLDFSLSQSIIKSVYTVLNHIYLYAVDKYHLEERYFKRETCRNTNSSIDTLDQSEQARLLRVLTQDIDVYKLGIYICLSTGLRLGEICALKWCDIDMELRLLHVNHTVQRLPVEEGTSKTILIESSPKSFYSKREIPLSNQLFDLLEKFKCSDMYVLNGNKPMEPRTLQYKFEQYLMESEIRKTNFHTLRHTFATNCIQTGADIKSVSEVLGHSDVKITLNKYVHPSMDTKREYLNSLSTIYGQISGQHIS